MNGWYKFRVEPGSTRNLLLSGIIISTLTSQFPGATGLRFIAEDLSWHALELVYNQLYQGEDDEHDKDLIIQISFLKILVQKNQYKY
jgi:hypothetical protein